MKLARGISVGLGAAIAAFVLISVLARFTDGPLGPFPGGALRDGPLVEDGVASWDFVAHVPEVELQLLEPERSRSLRHGVGEKSQPTRARQMNDEETPPRDPGHVDDTADGLRLDLLRLATGMIDS